MNGELKNFWDKPQGWTGIILLLLAIAIGGIAWYFLIPILLKLVGMTIAFFIGLIIVAFFVVNLADKNIRFKWWLNFKTIAMKITDIFIPIFPITRLRVLQNYFIQRRKNVEGSVTDLVKQAQIVDGQISSKQREIDRSRKIMRQTKDDVSKKTLFLLEARKAGRRQESTISLMELKSMLEMLIRVGRKILEACMFYEEDIADTISSLQEKLTSAKTVHRMIENAKEVILDSTAKKSFDETVEYTINFYNGKLGEVTDFIQMSKQFLDSVDIEKGIYEQDGIEMLKNWEKQSDSLLLGVEEKKQLINAAYDPEQALDLNQPFPEKEKVLASRPKGLESPYKQILLEDK